MLKKHILLHQKCLYAKKKKKRNLTIVFSKIKKVFTLGGVQIKDKTRTKQSVGTTIVHNASEARKNHTDNTVFNWWTAVFFLHQKPHAQYWSFQM